MKEIQMNQIINKLENNFYAVTYVTETGDTLCPRMFVQVKQKKNGKQKYSVHQLSKACKKFNNIADLKSYLIEIVAGENKNKNHSDYLPNLKEIFLTPYLNPFDENTDYDFKDQWIDEHEVVISV